jgi:hypothetical protein
VDGRDLGASGSVPVEFLITEGRDPNAFAFDRAKKDLVFCLHEEFGPEQQAKLRDVVRVNAFRKANYDQAQGKRREAIEMFSKQSEQKVQHLRDWFTRALKSCSYVSAQQVKDASNHNGGTAQDRYESILDEHLRQVFKKRELALGYASSRAELREAAADTQTDIDNSLAPAEQEVHGFLRRATGPNVADTVNHFSGTDYAWQDTETLHLLLNLERKNKWRFRWNSEDISRKSFAEKAVNRSERASITLHEQESIDPQVLYQVTQAVNQTIFNEPLIDQETDPRQLDGQIVQALREKRDHYDSLWRQHRGMPFASHLAKARDEVDDILDVSRMQDRFEELIERADRLQAAVDTAIQLESFVDANGETYKAIRDFVSRKQDEFDLLEPEDRETAEKLRSAVRTEERPDEEFPRIKQYYESVRGALQEQVDALRAEALDAYREAFDELEAYRDEQNVDDVLPSREEVLGPIRRTDDPNRLEAEKARVSEFQTQYRVKVRNAAEQAKAEQQPAGGDREDSSPATPKTTEPFSVSEALGQRDLESEDDVDDFLQDLRRELVRRVNDDKIIVIS